MEAGHSQMLKPLNKQNNACNDYEPLALWGGKA